MRRTTEHDRRDAGDRPVALVVEEPDANEPWRSTSRVMTSDAESVEIEAYVEADAEDALQAVLDGRSLVLRWRGRGDIPPRFIDDLRRLASVRIERAESESADEGNRAGLTAEQRALLEHIGAGRSVLEAARIEAMSRRTAFRRLAEARAALGVDSNVEAVIALGANEDDAVIAIDRP